MAWVQSFLASKPVWIAVRLLSVVGLARMGWQLAKGFALWRKAETSAATDAAAMPTLRLLSGSGAFLSGASNLLAGMAGSSGVGTRSEEFPCARSSLRRHAHWIARDINRGSSFYSADEGKP